MRNVLTPLSYEPNLDKSKFQIAISTLRMFRFHCSFQLIMSSRLTSYLLVPLKFPFKCQEVKAKYFGRPIATPSTSICA